MSTQIVLLGNADDIVQYLCERLHWILPPPTRPKATHLDVPAMPSKNGKRSSTEMIGCIDPVRVGDRSDLSHQTMVSTSADALISHVWLFHGAEGGKWVEDIRERCISSEQATPQRAVQHSEPGAKKPRVT